jgi:ATP-dependent exoDNAse (exonuclease V) beta subunit
LFSDGPWNLWSAREEIADWHEDLRTFYVACTRAEDYLILSASMTDPPKKIGTAMTVLLERFDRSTGACLDASISADERPLVRVIGPDMSFPETSVGRRNRDRPPPLTAADAAAIGPIHN